MNQSNNLISIIMSTYNESDEELQLSIESILNQTYGNFEFIIVCDNPNNSDIKNILDLYSKKDRRITIIHNDTNIGLAASLNRALDIAKGDFIARMDADDISLPNRLEVELEYLISNTNCDLVSSNVSFIDEKAQSLGTKTRFNIPDSSIKNIIKYGSVIVHPTIMARKNLFELLGGYNNFKAAQDYDLWLRAIKAGLTIHIITEVLLEYRIRVNSITKTNYYRQYLYTLFALKKYKRGNKDIGNIGVPYSQEEVDSFLKKNRLYDNDFSLRFNSMHEHLHVAIENKDFAVFIINMIKMMFMPQLFKAFVREVAFKFKIKLHGWG